MQTLQKTLTEVKDYVHKNGRGLALAMIMSAGLLFASMQVQASTTCAIADYGTHADTGGVSAGPLGSYDHNCYFTGINGQQSGQMNSSLTPSPTTISPGQTTTISQAITGIIQFVGVNNTPQCSTYDVTSGTPTLLPQSYYLSQSSFTGGTTLSPTKTTDYRTSCFWVVYNSIGDMNAYPYPIVVTSDASVPVTVTKSCTSPPNMCGQTVSGECPQNTPPANPSYYGQPCTSPANACGMTNTGTYDCSDVCSATTPPNSECSPATATLSANPTSYKSPGSSVLTYGSTNSANCSIDNGVGSVTPNVTDVVTVSPTKTTKYTITCNGYAGDVATASATVTVTDGGGDGGGGGGGTTLSCVDNAVNPVKAGDVITFNTSGNASAPYLWKMNGSTVPGSGSTNSYTMPNVDGPYSMTVTASGVTATCSPSMTEGCGAPLGTITANPARVNPKSPSTNTTQLSWTGLTGGDGSPWTVKGSDGSSYSAGLASGCSAPDGSAMSKAISAQTTFCLYNGSVEAMNSAGAPACVTVNVIPNYQEF